MASNAPLAVILAAGEGRRMGGPKARLLFDGAPLAWSHATRALASGFAAVTLVVRREDAPLLTFPEGEMPAVRFALSGAPDAAGSLAVGLAAGAWTADTIVLVTPVDLPPAEPATIAQLLRAVQSGAAAASPRFAGRGGRSRRVPRPGARAL